MATKTRSANAPITLNYSAVFQLEYLPGERAKVAVAGYQPFPNADSVALTVIRYSADGQTTNHATAVMTASEVAELCKCLRSAVPNDRRQSRSKAVPREQLI